MVALPPKRKCQLNSREGRFEFRYSDDSQEYLEEF
jgi:hypothetical protein